MSILIRAFIVWTLIAGVEMIHGILRARFLAPKVGDLRSRQIAVFSGIFLIYIATYLSFSWLSLKSAEESFLVGGLWFIWMMIFEFSVGRFIFKFSWKWLLNDFNILKGRLLAIGMISLFFAPYIMGRLLRSW